MEHDAPPSPRNRSRTAAVLIGCLVVVVVITAWARRVNRKFSSPPYHGSTSPATELTTQATEFINTLQMKFIRIEAGEFDMGDRDEPDRLGKIGATFHPVKITKPFLMAATPVTQAQWTTLMGNNPSTFRGERLPVESVSWNNAATFCVKLSQKEGRHYRLPTEAEWEYACRAGTKTAFSFGNGEDYHNLDDYGWYSSNSGNTTHDVGTRKPNPWGLYDMQGNVWQWCSDNFGPYRKGSQTDPKGPGLQDKFGRAQRGGSWETPAIYCLSASRNFCPQLYIGNDVGFRVCLDFPVPATTSPVPATQPHKAFTNEFQMKFVRMEPGEFDMGSRESEFGNRDDEVLHHVKITKPFMIADTPVTEAQWMAVMQDTTTLYVGERSPKNGVSWTEAVAFCGKLSQKAGGHYRLPTEAEWEYACRAGTTTAFSFGDEEDKLDDYGWFRSNSGERWHDVGMKKPNPWGLYDMHGNVKQWCSDYYGPYTGEAIDPKGPAQGDEHSSRVLRGGDFWEGPQGCRSAARDAKWPNFQQYHIGFRVCLDF